MTTANSGLTLSGCWKILHLLLKIPKAHSTYIPYIFVQSFFFLILRLDPPKCRSIFLFSANHSSPTKKYGTLGPFVPQRGLSLGISSIFVLIDAYSADRLKIAESVFSVSSKDETFENNLKKNCLSHLVVHQIVCKRHRILPFFEILDEPNAAPYAYVYDDSTTRTEQ